MQEGSVIQVAERLDREVVQEMLQELDGATHASGDGSDPVVVDIGQVEKFDSAGLGGLLVGLQRARERGRTVKLRGVSQPMLELFSLVSVDRLLGRPAPVEREHPVVRLGAAVEPRWRTLTGVFSLTAQAFRSLGRGLRLDRTIIEVDQTAGGALPIVALIGFLLGLVLAMQAWVQLQIWGAEIYMADMVGVSVTSEIGPLMTAILLAARSGSSNAAQLGAMVIGEEIDALEQMGVRPVRFLVVPKVMALAFASVALGLVFDTVAMSGGALFGFTVAGIDPAAYMEQTRQALHFSEFGLGKLKALVFGLCVGVVSCSLGLRVTGGSEGVAKATTRAVVMSIFLIIVIDAVFVSTQRMLFS